MEASKGKKSSVASKLSGKEDNNTTETATTSATNQSCYIRHLVL